MTHESPLRRSTHGMVPGGSGWFVLNAGDAEWQDGPFGAFTPFENVEGRFAELGINLAVLSPGQPNGRYHAEANQEDFLVLDGECLLLIEDEERRLRRWDFVHCPARTAHIFVGVGDRPCLLLGVGARASHSIVYPVSELARRHGAGVAEATEDPRAAYADCADDAAVAFDPAWLPGA